MASTGFENGVAVIKNVNFDYTAAQPRTGILTANGDLIIGSTANPNVAALKGQIVSNTLTVGYSAPNITIEAGGGVGQTITGDDGTPLHPTAGNWNVFGQQAGTIPVMQTNGAASTLRIENRTWNTRFVVDPSATVGLRGTYQTIAAALTDATSGTDIFIRPGTYTENLTLKAGVNLCGYGCDALNGQITIVGKCSFSSAGTVTISGIRLQTNSDNFLSITGSAASIVNLQNCDLNAINATGISLTSSSSSAQVNVRYCTGDIGTTGIGMHTSTSAGGILYHYTKISNSGGSTTQNSNSAGQISFFGSQFEAPLATSSTGTLSIIQSRISSTVQNVTCITLAGTGSGIGDLSSFGGGTATAISIGTGTSMTLRQSIINSSNTNAISGLGSLLIGNVEFTGSSNISVTTVQSELNQMGIYRAGGQPAFMYILGTQDDNKTGAGTLYTIGSGNALTKIYDQASNCTTGGTFTAPYTGLYVLSMGIGIGGLTSAMTTGSFRIVTTARTFAINTGNPFGMATVSGSYVITGTVLAQMTAGDTATFNCTISSGAGDTADILATSSGTERTWISGYLYA